MEAQTYGHVSFLALLSGGCVVFSRLLNLSEPYFRKKYSVLPSSQSRKAKDRQYCIWLYISMGVYMYPGWGKGKFIDICMKKIQ